MTILEASRQVAADFDRLQKLGFTREDMNEYYEKLPYVGGSASDEEAAFCEMIAGHSLSNEDRAFLKKLLDNCDPRGN